MHRGIECNNPVPASMLLWPIVLIILGIYYGFRLMFCSLNWISGNGFVRRTQLVSGSTKGCDKRVVDLRKNREAG